MAKVKLQITPQHQVFTCRSEEATVTSCPLRRISYLYLDFITRNSGNELIQVSWKRESQIAALRLDSRVCSRLRCSRFSFSLKGSLSSVARLNCGSVALLCTLCDEESEVANVPYHDIKMEKLRSELPNLMLAGVAAHIKLCKLAWIVLYFKWRSFSLSGGSVVKTYQVMSTSYLLVAHYFVVGHCF